jgi:hypothetical protein
MRQSNRRLLQALKDEQNFFQSGGYGRPFRGEWRPTLLFRDSPVCINFTCAGALNPCQECPLFLLAPARERSQAIPCHHIVLDTEGNTIDRLYQKGSQKALDRRYCDWLSCLIRGLEPTQAAA